MFAVGRAARFAAACLTGLCMTAVDASERFDVARAKQNYQLHCMGCHGEEGMGLEGHVPPIRLTLAPLLATAAGREYVLRVPGIAQSSLTSHELADVLNWLLHNLSVASTARVVAPLSPSEVARFRDRPWLDVQRARSLVAPAGMLSPGIP